MNIFFGVILFFLSLLYIGCNSIDDNENNAILQFDNNDSLNLSISYKEIERAHRDTFDLIALPYNKRPNSSFKKAYADEVKRPTDTDDIELFYYRGQVSYHPVFMSQRMRGFLNAYVETKDDVYLARAEKYASKLIELAVIENNVKYGINTFRYAVHGDSSTTFERFFPSGMVQGEMLCVFSRLFGITGNEKYLNFANEIFPSFFKTKEFHQFWTVRVNDDNYYWVEEYAHDIRPGMTLNGFNYALFGIYEYYLITNNKDAKLIYDMMLTTLINYLPEYLKSEERSYYCLGHKTICNDAYHVLHFQQLQELYKLTNDERFIDFYNQFKARPLSTDK